ncbi:hypothetical protein DFP72DRAFT_894263 [Ephemerocybe angulata]|uniref:Uncharacterized protein n=1 Tax=Ephemerocybe angulata TaxID=980116 RepID=A0A8H6I1Y0_9AGAR|nr:hypothetical protein DFP72DRAFT_894263 [Tulosesus angulatus]
MPSQMSTKNTYSSANTERFSRPSRRTQVKAFGNADLLGKPGSALFGTPSSSRSSASLESSTWTPPPESSSAPFSTSGWGSGSPYGSANRSGDSGVAQERPNLGYLAFPPGSSSAMLPDHGASFGETAGGSTSSDIRNPTPTPPPPAEETLEDDWSAHLASLHAARLAREAPTATAGEEYWVSCGGVLRNPTTGKRDIERTRAVKEELRVRERERKLREQWDAYVNAWDSLVARVRSRGKGKGKEMQSEDDPLLSFADIPWPISPPPKDAPSPGTKEETVALLRATPIATFLLSPLTIRSESPTLPRDRVRSALLRWHPDKMGALLDMVRPDEREDVQNAVHAVLRALQVIGKDLPRFWDAILKAMEDEKNEAGVTR